MTSSATTAPATASWLKERNARHLFQPMQDPKQTQEHPPLIITDSEGVYVSDIDGRRFIDCQGGLWCVNAGHNRREIKDAIVQQLDRLPYYSLFPGSTNAPAIALSARLCEITAAEGMKKVVFGLSGSDAVETALKTARQYWKLSGEAERVKFISLRGGYHGVNFGGMSACGGDVWRRSYEPLVPGFFQAEYPNLYRNPFTSDPEELAQICATLLEREILHQVPDTVAAVIAEPVQGAGGVNVPPASYWSKLRQICDRYGVLLIADEVITGLGRTGSLFGCRGWGVKPDIMCLAKGVTSGYLPLSATLLNARVADAWNTAGPRSVYMHGYTYGGHPVACAAGMASVDLIIRENLTENARVVGDYLLRKLSSLKERHEAIGDVRGKGLMIAVDLVADRNSREPLAPDHPYLAGVSDQCQARGVIVRTIGNKFTLSPPLTFTTAHADQVSAVLDEALAAVRFVR